MAYGEDFRAAFGLLAEHGLSFDCWLWDENIAALAALARDFPDTTIVCDHCAAPRGLVHGREAAWKKWQVAMAELAAFPNVVVKLSGFAMCVCGFGFEHWATPPGSEELAAAWRPYLEHCIRCFGTELCMFASNFPMDKVSCSYTALFNAFKRVAEGYSAKEQDDLFHDTAQRVYRL